MQVTRGRLLAKGGAEAYQGVGIPAGAIGGNSPAMGIAVKIADGDGRGRARATVVIAVLEALGALSESEVDALEEFGTRPVTNYRGLTVGQLRACFRLEQVG